MVGAVGVKVGRQGVGGQGSGVASEWRVGGGRSVVWGEDGVVWW